jgi:hypothetical protein
MWDAAARARNKNGPGEGGTMMAVVRDRFTELLVDCGLGVMVVATAIYALLRLFRRDESDGPPA